MTDTTLDDPASAAVWARDNQRHLMLAAAAAAAWLDDRRDDAEGSAAAAAFVADDVLERLGEPVALDRISSLFSLTSFEHWILVGAAAPELGLPTATGPVTFARALERLPDAHWSAVVPDAPLRGWRLLDVPAQLPPADFGGVPQLPLAIDERLLHALLGADTVDDRLAGRCSLVDHSFPLAPSQLGCVRELAGLVRPDAAGDWVQVVGQDIESRREAAFQAAASLGLTLLLVDGDELPVESLRLDAFARLVAREAGLGGRVVLVEGDDTDLAVRMLRNPALRAVPRLLSTDANAETPAFTVRLSAPAVDERVTLFAAAVQRHGIDADCEVLAREHPLGSADIARGVERAARGDPRATTAEVAAVCRRLLERPLGGLATVRTPSVKLDDLVLTPAADRALRAMLAHIAQRSKVYEEWGWADRGRGLALTALFAGPSGTGKTTAAEAIAAELGREVVAADLSQVMSKYIGDTPKHLDRLFEAAEAGAVLLFDEGDALFGKRTAVRDSHDRYANLESAYLLQRIEDFRGIAIVTTNARESIDSAFMRRMRFVVTFPFPDAEQRARLWRAAFPPEVPTEGLDHGRLAQLAVAGGTIAQLALQAAFLAAAAGEPVRMAHVLEAARIECDKLERPLAANEVRGWVV